MKDEISNLKNTWNKKTFAPVYLFYGDEDYLFEELVADLIPKALEPEETDFNLDILYGNEVDPVQVVNIASAFPMMAQRRVVRLKSANLIKKNLNILASYVEKPAPSTILILTASKIDGKDKSWKRIKNNSVVVETKPLYDNQIPDWIRSYMASRGREITPEAIRLLHASTGNSLRALSAEIDKILLSIGDEKQLNVAQVEAVVGTSKSYNIFEFCDSIGGRNLPGSLHILSQMIQMGESPVGMLAMLIRHYYILSKLKELQSQRLADKEMAKELKLHPFFLKQYRQQAQKVGRRQLNAVFRYLMEADEQLKTSYQKPGLVLEILLVKIHLAYSKTGANG